jgi:iron complex outermembrane receptor protein
MHTLEAPGYVLFGAQAGMKFPHGLSIYADARNLSNEHYVSDLTTIIDARGQIPAVFYPGSGRSISGGVRWAF